MQEQTRRSLMRSLDYSFLESGMLPAGLVNVVDAVAVPVFIHGTVNAYI
jgi:hypothetical protein